MFSVPAQVRALPRWTGQPGNAGVELGRFVLLDDVPANGETWFLARAFDVLRDEKPGVRAILSYSDPIARADAAGKLVKPGHVGCIYQAHNGRFLGRSGARTLLLAPSGRVASARAISKVRNRERGAEHAERNLVALGAPERGPREDPRAWLDRALRSFRRLRHPGNFVYAWGLDRRASRLLPQGLRYPKSVAA